VTLYIKTRGRKVKMCRFSSGFAPPNVLQFAETSERHSKAVYLIEKSVINMMGLLIPVVDCPNIMIGPGGLL